MGIESAAVSAGVIENPKRNIPLATLMGLGLSAVVYLLSSSVIMGIIPNAELRTSHAPFAEAARIAAGTPGAVIVSLCAILKSLGSLGGWMLLVGQSAKAAAGDGMFPRVFARLNRHQVPGAGLVIVAALMTIVLFATMSPTLAGQFSRIVDLAVILAVIPYIYASVALVKIVHDRLPRGPSRPTSGSRSPRRLLPLGRDGRRSADGRERHGGAPLSVPLYPFFIRSMEAAAQRKQAVRGTAHS
jgi:arginine:agmatine antiporter